MIIGAQLYTLRDFCRNLDDFSETLKKVADIGYTSVQVSGTCPYEAEWLRDELKKNGLTCGITHFDFNRVLNDTDKVIEEHKTFGCRYIGLGSMPGGASKYAEFRDNPKLIPAVDKIAAAGMKFMYHNHSGEYETLTEDGRPVMFHLSDDFTPAQMGFTLDTYWVKYGGFDVVPEIERLAGRLPRAGVRPPLPHPRVRGRGLPLRRGEVRQGGVPPPGRGAPGAVRQHGAGRRRLPHGLPGLLRPGAAGAHP